MTSGEPDGDPSDGRPAAGPATTASAVLLGASAIAQIAYGVAAFAGNATLEGNIREIESNPDFGEVYLSLAGWGTLLALVGIAELAAAWSLKRRARHSRLLGLGAALFGLAAAFFTLAIFRVAAIVTMALLFAALYVLSYRVD